MDASLEFRVDGELVFSSAGRWLHPLFELEEFIASRGIDPSRGELRDKVVGRGSAFLIARLGIRRVHASLLSLLGREVFDRAGIGYTWDTLVKRVACATEGLLERVTNPEDAYSILRERAGAGGRP